MTIVWIILGIVLAILVVAIRFMVLVTAAGTGETPTKVFFRFCKEAWNGLKPRG